MLVSSFLMHYHFNIVTILPKRASMSINRLLSPFILKRAPRKTNTTRELQRHSDAERVAFVDETFVEPSYGKDGKLHPGYYPSQQLLSKPTTSLNSAKTSLRLSEALTTGTPPTRPTIQLEKAEERRRTPPQKFPWLVQKTSVPCSIPWAATPKMARTLSHQFQHPHTDDPDERLRLRDAARAEAITVSNHAPHPC